MGDSNAIQIEEVAPPTCIVKGKSVFNDATPSDVNKLNGYVFADQYKLQEKLGSGAFGVIYRAKDLKHEGVYFGCKVERADTKHPQVIFEARLYNFLHNNINRPAVGIPRCVYFQKHGDFNIMIMELLGNSLEQVFNLCSRRFGLKTVLMLADQMIQRVEYLHSRNFIHRDIKPDNFLLGTSKRESRVYMIDFGLAKRFLKDTDHIPFKEGKNLTGTARYASINTHVGIEQSRRDDLESLGYMFVYFLKGQLPWQNIRAKDKKEKYEKIQAIKQNTSIEDLCSGLPTEFAWFLTYTRQLEFADKPDYQKCISAFKELMIRSNFIYDAVWDWSLLGSSKKAQQTSNHQQPPYTTQDPLIAPIVGVQKQQPPQLRSGLQQPLLNHGVPQLLTGYLNGAQLQQQQQQQMAGFHHSQQQYLLANQQTRAKYYGNIETTTNREQLQAFTQMRDNVNQQINTTPTTIPNQQQPQQFSQVNIESNSPRKSNLQVEKYPSQMPADVLTMMTNGNHLLGSGSKGQNIGLYDYISPTEGLTATSQSTLAKQGNAIINNTTAQLNFYQSQQQQQQQQAISSTKVNASGSSTTNNLNGQNQQSPPPQQQQNNQQFTRPQAASNQIASIAPSTQNRNGSRDNVVRGNHRFQ